MTRKPDSKSEGESLLRDLVEKALEAGADGLSIEYEDGGLEVCFVFGNTGVGGLITDRESECAIVGALVDLADLEEAENGQFEMEIEGRNLIVDVAVFESFGESAFRLKF